MIKEEGVVVIERPLVGESGSNGAVENAMQRTHGQARALRLAL